MGVRATSHCHLWAKLWGRIFYQSWLQTRGTIESRSDDGWVPLAGTFPMALVNVCPLVNFLILYSAPIAASYCSGTFHFFPFSTNFLTGTIILFRILGATLVAGLHPFLGGVKSSISTQWPQSSLTKMYVPICWKNRTSWSLLAHLDAILQPLWIVITFQPAHFWLGFPLT